MLTLLRPLPVESRAGRDSAWNQPPVLQILLATAGACGQPPSWPASARAGHVARARFLLPQELPAPELNPASPQWTVASPCSSRARRVPARPIGRAASNFGSWLAAPRFLAHARPWGIQIAERSS